MKPPLVEGEDYYVEKGLVVLTEKYHLSRGYCGGNGARHCPSQNENVPEPNRTQLLQRRADTDKPNNHGA